MKFAVSNIGWSEENDSTVLPLLKEAGVDGIEVAPGRLFANPVSVTVERAKVVAACFTDVGLPIVSMQALLFGRPDLRLFGNANEQNEFRTYLIAIIKLAGALGCGPLVFGSPKNRLKNLLDFDEASIRMSHFLREIGAAANISNTVFCLEANSTKYGCDFMTRLEQAAHVAALTKHPRIGIVADTGNMIMEDELPSAVIAVKQHMAHFHVSAPNLGPVEPHIDYIKQTINHLSDVNYDGILTLEMRVPDDKDPVGTLLRNVALIRNQIK